MSVESVNLRQIISFLDSKTPQTCAEKWDNVGLTVSPGLESIDKVTTRSVVVGTDLTEEALKKAKSTESRLIVTHHPCIFPKSQGLSKLSADHLGLQAFAAGIAVYSTHTNFDTCALEVIDQISTQLDVNPKGRLSGFSGDSPSALQKLAVFVPETHHDQVLSALAQAGCGHIGNYDSCAFSVEGEGSFRALSGANPFLGKPGVLEKVREKRIETIFPRGLQGEVLNALRKAHPYDEVAYDLYSVSQKPTGHGLVRGSGYGFWGDFESKLAWSDFLPRVKKAFEVSECLVTSYRPQSVGRVAFSPGNGASMIESAIKSRCDVFITGEVGYHEGREAGMNELCVIELGHPQSELYFSRVVGEWLKSLGVDAVTVASPLANVERL